MHWVLSSVDRQIKTASADRIVADSWEAPVIPVHTLENHVDDDWQVPIRSNIHAIHMCRGGCRRPTSL
ncbi:protein of unknown function [Hyphomicrobium sp. MC1]|nr:protein of unknown function [Hyphomicrobium sp. MC1]